MLKLGTMFRILPSVALLQAFHLSVLMQCSMQMSSSGSSNSARRFSGCSVRWCSRAASMVPGCRFVRLTNIIGEVVLQIVAVAAGRSFK